MVKVSRKISERIKLLIDGGLSISEPIIYTIQAKTASGSLGTHGFDCYQIGHFTNLTEDKLIDISASTELAWITILMHDDILDKDTIRYDKPTAWVKFGKLKTIESIEYGLKAARSLHPFKNNFNKMYTDCLDAMEAVKNLPLDTRSPSIEEAYHGYTFGCYDYLLPFDSLTKETLALIGYKKMLMAQLINDYKDTCGSRRQSRVYPELREKQANYITSLYLDSCDVEARIQIAKLIKQASNTDDYEAISMMLRANDTNVNKKLNLLEAEISEQILRIKSQELRTYMQILLKQTIESFRAIIRAEISMYKHIPANNFSDNFLINQTP